LVVWIKLQASDPSQPGDRWPRLVGLHLGIAAQHTSVSPLSLRPIELAPSRGNSIQTQKETLNGVERDAGGAKKWRRWKPVCRVWHEACFFIYRSINLSHANAEGDDSNSKSQPAVASNLHNSLKAKAARGWRARSVLHALPAIHL
jgi:hypothetical protein